jgi:hypothetical protein
MTRHRWTPREIRIGLVVLAVALVAIGGAVLVSAGGGGADSKAEWKELRESCQYLREAGRGGDFACDDVEEAEFEEGWGGSGPP